MILDNVLDLIWGDGQKRRTAFQQFVEGNADLSQTALLSAEDRQEQRGRENLNQP